MEKGKGLLLQADADEQALSGIALLQRAREEGSGRAGLQSLYRALSIVIEIVENRIDKYEDFQQHVDMACDLLKKIEAISGVQSDVGDALSEQPSAIASIRQREGPDGDPWQEKTAQSFGHLIYRELKRSMESVAGSDLEKLTQQAKAMEARLKKKGLIPG